MLVVSPDVFSADLNSAEFRVIVTLYHLAGADGHVEVTTADLAILTQYSTESLRRAFRGLEEAGLLITERTRKGFNKFSENRYWVHVHKHIEEGPVKGPGWPEKPSHKAVGSKLSSHKPVGYTDPSPHKDVVSTASKLTKVVNSYIPTSSKVTSNYKSINFVNTYCAWAQEGTKMNKWQDDSSSLAGFGLLEDEQPKPVAKINKRDYRTRHQRPEHEWTPYDVAAEFSSGLGQRFPYLAGLVNTGVVAGALRRYRSQIGTDAAVETELLRMFFEDPYKLRDIEKSDPMKIPGRYLNMFKTDINEALRRIGLPQHKQVTVKPEPVQQVLRPVTIRGVDFVMDDEYVYTSDGEAFDKASSMHNSILEHEESLKQNVV